MSFATITISSINNSTFMSSSMTMVGTIWSYLQIVNSIFFGCWNVEYLAYLRPPGRRPQSLPALRKASRSAAS